MTSILILENQEPGECELCPVHLRNAGICSLTMRFDGEGCPLKRAQALPTNVYLRDMKCKLVAVEE